MLPLTLLSTTSTAILLILMEGGELVLQANKRLLGKIKTQTNTLLYFQGDLTHSVNAVKTPGNLLSLVCEQYNLTESELQQIPQFALESRAATTKKKKNSY